MTEKHSEWAASFYAGEQAFDAGVPRRGNPYAGTGKTGHHRGWDSGWLARDARMAERMAERLEMAMKMEMEMRS